MKKEGVSYYIMLGVGIFVMILSFALVLFNTDDVQKALLSSAACGGFMAGVYILYAILRALQLPLLCYNVGNGDVSGD